MPQPKSNNGKPDNRTLIESAIAKGWIRLRMVFQKPKVAKAEYSRRMRARRYAAGLNWAGQPRKTKQHPELKGLPRREYQARYMEQWRERVSPQ